MVFILKNDDRMHVICIRVIENAFELYSHLWCGSSAGVFLVLFSPILHPLRLPPSSVSLLFLLPSSSFFPPLRLTSLVTSRSVWGCGGGLRVRVALQPTYRTESIEKCSYNDLQVRTLVRITVGRYLRGMGVRVWGGIACAVLVVRRAAYIEGA